MRRVHRWLAPVLVAAVAAAGCSDDDGDVGASASTLAPSTAVSMAASTVPVTAAATSTPTPALASEDLPTVVLQVDSDHVAYRIEHDGSLSVSELRDPSRDPGCGTTTAFFSGLRDLRIEAVPSSCSEVGTIDVATGAHGRYRTLDDVAEPIGVEEVATALGPAVLFEQDYGGTLEPVAIVTLDEPRDPEYPTLVIRSFDAGFDREALRGMLASLAPAGNMFAD